MQPGLAFLAVQALMGWLGRWEGGLLAWLPLVIIRDAAATVASVPFLSLVTFRMSRVTILALRESRLVAITRISPDDLPCESGQ